MTSHQPRSATLAPVLVLGLALVGCGGSTNTSRPPTKQPKAALATRVDSISRAVSAWDAASDLPGIKAAAEQARNLIVGEDGPRYGDADGNGSAQGVAATGLLPSPGGQPGLVALPAASSCIDRDVLGGSWSDPAARWRTADTAIARWRTDNNTFPNLPSHPQRVYGWATLALGATDYATAHEYASHARLHVDVTRTAIKRCD